MGQRKRQVIYFIEHAGRIKVGYAKNVENRLKSYRTAMPDFVRLGSMEGNRNHERTIKNCLAPHKIAGEWFRDCPEVRSFLIEAMRDGVRETPISRRVYTPTMWDQRAKKLVAIICADNQALDIRRLEAEHSIPRGAISSLRYRQSREISVGEYFALLTAARAIVGRRREALERDAAFISDLEREDADETNASIDMDRRLAELRAEAERLGIKG